MRENKLTIEIDKPVKEVFDFTINPENTHLWFTSIQEELSEEYPPKKGTVYKNRGALGWNAYKVSEFERNRIFTLTALGEDYSVRYTYTSLGANKTRVVYYEWSEKGELKNPSGKEPLLILKSVLEKKH